MTSLFTTEGIVLRTVPFRERDCVATLFTPDNGLLPLFVKRSPPFCAPLYQVEATYSEGRNALHRCHDISLLNSYLSLRKELPRLELACDLLRVVYMTQSEGQAALPIYQLLLFYLDKLGKETNLSFFCSSFQLKVLSYEGLLVFPIPKNLDGNSFNAEEEELLHYLCTTRSYSTLASLTLTIELQRRISQFFESQLTS